MKLSTDTDTDTDTHTHSYRYRYTHTQIHSYRYIVVPGQEKAHSAKGVLTVFFLLLSPFGFFSIFDCAVIYVNADRKINLLAIT